MAETRWLLDGEDHCHFRIVVAAALLAFLCYLGVPMTPEIITAVLAGIIFPTFGVMSALLPPKLKSSLMVPEK